MCHRYGPLPCARVVHVLRQVCWALMDGRSDLYSLGAVAYFLLTGHPPFEHDDYRRLFAAHLTEAVPPLRRWCPAVPHDLERIMLRCLEKKPADRYADAESLEAALAASAAAGQWTWSQAEAWWREYVDAAALP